MSIMPDEITSVALRGGTVTDISLTLPDDMSPDEFSALGTQLNYLDHGVRWWIGDWLLHGEGLWSEEVWQYIDDMPVGKSALISYRWVSENYAPGERRADVAWSIHRELATHADREFWLDRVASEGLSVMELKEAMQNEIEIGDDDNESSSGSSSSGVAEFEFGQPTLEDHCVSLRDWMNDAEEDSGTKRWLTSNRKDPKRGELFDIIDAIVLEVASD